ncbi:ATP-binding protein [uncultured Proteiniphilum sp.]|uniref:AAA family ATPase n=1 Tax=uncultured Proteiniphilum sp. TaxID=497637 RepID=UPI0026332247|nr:ATP-binding protein [uncultured Proteiniphilum sp.]
MENPFIFGLATWGEWFTDRETDAKRLSANFRYGVNTILISPRRWGKTSLVRKVSEDVRSSNLKVVTMDVFACRNAEEFYTLYATELIKQTASRWEEWVENAKRFLSGLVPRISFGVDPMTDFTLSFDFSNQQQNEEVLNLPQKIAKEKGIHMVVCLDEFQQIAEFDNALYFQRKLRSAWQLHQDVTYCLYGSKQHLMTKLFSKQSMPFYKFGDVIYLQKINTADWIAFICRRFEVTGKQISPQLAEKICLTVENHSSYVQQLAWLLWVQTDVKATEAGFEAAYTDLLNQNSMLYFKYIDGLTTYQLNFLYAVAVGVTSEFTRSENLVRYQLGTSANIRRLKTSLENKELIDISGKTVSFNDPIFKLWFKKNVRRF